MRSPGIREQKGRRRSGADLTFATRLPGNAYANVKSKAPLESIFSSGPSFQHSQKGRRRDADGLSGENGSEIQIATPCPRDARATLRRRAPLWNSKARFRRVELGGRCAHDTGHSRRERAARGDPRALYNFRLERRNGITCSRVMCVPGIQSGCIIVLGKRYFTRQAATLLQFARLTSNPALAASLIERAADLKAQVDADKRPDARVWRRPMSRARHRRNTCDRVRDRTSQPSARSLRRLD